MRLFKTKRSFKSEFKRQIKFAIIAAVGFTIAFAWREYIFASIENLANNLSIQLNLGQSPIFTPILLSIIGVIIILITSKLFRD
jgi:uncharacterized membrane protein